MPNEIAQHASDVIIG